MRNAYFAVWDDFIKAAFIEIGLAANVGVLVVLLDKPVDEHGIFRVDALCEYADPFFVVQAFLFFVVYYAKECIAQFLNDEKDSF